MKTGNRNSLKIPKMYSLIVCNGQQEKGIKMDKTIHRKLKIEQHEVTPSFESRVWCYIYIYHILSIDMTVWAYV